MTETRLSYTRDEAARICGVSVDTIKRAIATGALRAKRTAEGGRILITEKALNEWLEGLVDA